MSKNGGGVKPENAKMSGSEFCVIRWVAREKFRQPKQ